MRNTIKILEQIQAIDIEIGAVEDESKACLAGIEEASAFVRKFEEEKASLAPRIDELKALAGAAENKVREAGEKAARNEKRLNEIKNDKELKALNKETSDAKKALKQGEEDLKLLAAKLQAAEAAFSAKSAEAEAKTSEIGRLTAEMESKKPVWASLIEEKRQKREGLKAGLRPDFYKKYEMIRAKRSGRALVSVRKETCQGCYIHIPPQAYIELKKGVDDLVTCPHCYRILYVEEETQPQTV